jgi:G3E family GTPase
VIALVDAVHADEQMNQFTIAQSQVGYADRILLTKTDRRATAKNCANWRVLRAPVYTVTHGDIDLSQLFNTNGFMLEENVTSSRAFTLWPTSKTTCRRLWSSWITRWISATCPG